jgi:ATP-dependent protease ClpP protease subunit
LAAEALEYGIIDHILDRNHRLAGSDAAGPAAS